MALAVAFSTESQAQDPTVKGVRTLQLLILTGILVPSPEIDASEPQVDNASVWQGGAASDTIGGERAFHVHDLSRRWVEFETRNRLKTGKLEGGVPIGEGDPLAYGLKIGAAPSALTGRYPPNRNSGVDA